MYTNIKRDVSYKGIKYQIYKFHDDIPLHSRFTKALIFEGLNIILKSYYFYINKTFFHQIKGTAFYKLINELDQDLKFIFEKLTTDTKFLDINIKIVHNQLHFDI